MNILKHILFAVYSIFSDRKVAVLRDINNKVSFVYRDTTEADFVVKEQCDPQFEFAQEPDVEANGFKGKLLSGNLVLMIVDIHSALNNKILTANEKQLIMNSMFNKNSDLLIQT